MDDNQNANQFALPSVHAGAPSTKLGSTPYHPAHKLSKTTDVVGATKLPRTKEDTLDPLKKWNLTCTSSSSSAVDNDLSLITNPVRQSVQPSICTYQDPTSHHVASLLQRINEAVLQESHQDQANIREIMRRSSSSPPPHPFELVTAEETETTPCPGRSRCLPLQQTQTEVEQQREVEPESKYPSHFYFKNSHQGKGESGGESPDCFQAGNTLARAISEEIIVLKPSTGVSTNDSLEALTSIGALGDVPMKLPELKFHYPSPIPEGLPHVGLVGGTTLLHIDTEADDDSIMTSEAEFLSFINTEDECEDEELDEIDEIADELVDDDDQEWVKKASEGFGSDSSSGSSLHSQESVLNMVDTLVGQLNPICPSKSGVDCVIESLTTSGEQFDGAKILEKLEGNALMRLINEAEIELLKENEEKTPEYEVINVEEQDYLNNEDTSKEEEEKSEEGTPLTYVVVSHAIGAPEEPVDFNGNPDLDTPEVEAECSEPSSIKEYYNQVPIPLIDPIIQIVNEILTDEDSGESKSHVEEIADFQTTAEVKEEEQEIPTKEKESKSSTSSKSPHKTCRFQEEVVQLPSTSASLTMLINTDEVEVAARSPSESNLRNNNSTTAQGSGSESDDEDDGSQELGPNGSRLLTAREVTSSRTLIRKRFYKKRRDSRIRPQESSTSDIVVSSNVTEATARMGLTNLKTTTIETTVEIVPPAKPKILAVRPKSATDQMHKPVIDQMHKFKPKPSAQAKAPVDSSEAGDNRRKKTPSNKQLEIAHSEAVDNLVSALARFQSVQSSRERKRAQRPYTASGELSNGGSVSYPSTSTSTTAPSTPKVQRRTPWTASNRVEKKQALTKSTRPWTSPQAPQAPQEDVAQSRTARTQTPKWTNLPVSPYKKPLVSKKTLQQARNETFDRLATPKVLTEYHSSCHGCSSQKKVGSGKASESKKKTRPSSALPMPKTSSSSAGGNVSRLKLAPFHPIPEQERSTSKKNDAKRGGDQDSLQVLVKRNLPTIPSVEGQDIVKKVVVIKDSPENCSAHLCQGTQTKRKGSKKGILKNPSSEKVNPAGSKTLSISFQADTPPQKVASTSRSHSTKSVRILHHPIPSNQSNQSCSSVSELGHPYLIQSPKQIFKDELSDDSQKTIFKRKCKLPTRRLGEVAVSYDEGEESPEEDEMPYIEGMEKFQVTMLAPINADMLRGSSHVDLKFIVRRKNSSGSYPEIKDFEDAIKPQNIYLIIDGEEQSNGRNEDLSNIQDSPLAIFLPGLCSPTSQSLLPPPWYSILDGGRLQLNQAEGEPTILQEFAEKLELLKKKKKRKTCGEFGYVFNQ